MKARGDMADCAAKLRGNINANWVYRCRRSCRGMLISRGISMAHFETIDGHRSGDGLDPTERPPWLLVRVGTPKQIRLRDAANWSVSAPRQGLVSAVAEGAPNTSNRLVTVTAVGEGMTTMEAGSPDGRQAIYLTVYTRPWLRCTIASISFVTVPGTPPDGRKQRRKEFSIVSTASIRRKRTSGSSKSICGP
jgi:hypothetical protein